MKGTTVESAMNLEDVAGQVIDAALRNGATAADVVAVEGDSLEVAVRLGEVDRLKQAHEKHLGLRVFVGERSAVTSSADFSRQSLERLAAESCELARVLAQDSFAGLPQPPPDAAGLPEMDLCDPEVVAVSAERAIEFAQEAEAAARDADARITNSEGAHCHTSHGRRVYTSSAGFCAGYDSSSISLWAVPVATENGAMQRDHWFSASRKLAGVEAPADVGRKAAERALRRLNARQVRTCEVPVVFDQQTAASLMGHLAAAVSGDAIYKGLSFLAGKLGQRIAPEIFTVIDDGRLRGGLASKPFDGEGLPTRRNVIVERGNLASYLCDTYTARKLGMASTGNASRSVGGSPHPAATNFVLQAGTTSPEEIIKSVKSGFYVTELIGFGVNGTTGDYSRGAAGLWIEDGQLAYPVEQVTIAGHLLSMYDAIEVIGNDLDLRRAIVAPTLKIGRMTIAGN
jgi:PmbA protein